ncbi:MAG: sensor histidine kinase, partial [Firmicutes bacterium]|nr:sensor histidine kinase [Bacillota bacterium]
NLSSTNPRAKTTAQRGLYDLLLQYRVSLLPGAELIVSDSYGNIVTTYNLQPTPDDLIPEIVSNKSKTWQLRFFPYYQSSDLRTPGRLLELTARIISLPGQPQSGSIILHMDYRIVESIMTNITLRENNLSRYQSDAIVFGPDQQVVFPWIAPPDPVLKRAYHELTGGLRDTQAVEQIINGKKHLAIATVVPWTPWEVYISAPTKLLYAGLEEIYDYIVSIGIICIFAAVVFATLISFLVTQPVNKLRKVMRSVEEGDFSVRAPESGPLEIRTLGRAFNLMLSEVNLLTRRLVAEESARKNAVIKALQHQIAPHFLFNTLSALAGMTIKRPPKEVADALRSLKRLLYLSIGKEGDYVTLADEFEHIHHYLYLMNIRYPGKFALEMDLPSELRDCLTIRLVLQPIVENSINHGLKSQGGKVRISARQEDERIIMMVVDNGVGMSREHLDSIWGMKQNRSGVGVCNVDERLKLSFGPDYGLVIRSLEGEGTAVAIHIPIQYAVTSKAGQLES